MYQDMNILVVGGSLSGPTAALTLRQAGFTNITVVEASAEPQPQAGGLVSLAPTVYPAFEAIGLSPSSLQAYPCRQVHRFELPDTSNNPRLLRQEGTPTTWDILHHAVASRAGVVYGKRANTVLSDGRQVVIGFTDGSYIAADLVIFADGRNSFGRRYFDTRPLSYQGWLVWRGICEYSPTPQLHFSQYINRRGFFFAVSGQIAQGIHAGKSQWIMYQNVDEDTYHTLLHASPCNKPYRFPHQVNMEAKDTMASYAHQHLPSHLADIVTSTPEISVVAINDLTFPTKAFWQVGGSYVLLLGDALMPVSPTTAHSLNNGIEQAMCLIESFVGASSIGMALQAWQDAILPPLAGWVKMGQDLNRRLGMGINN